MTIIKTTAKTLSEAERLRRASKFQESLVLYIRAKAMAEAQYDVENTLKATIGGAHAARLVGDFKGSISYYQDALDIAEAGDALLSAADCMIGISLSLKGLCRWNEALQYVKTARGIYKKGSDQKGLAYALWAEGAIWRVAGDIKRALASYRKANRVFEDTGFLLGKAYCLCGLGGCTRVAGDFKLSLAYYIEAHSIFRSLRDLFGKAYSHCGIGNAYRMLSDFKAADIHFKRAEALYQKIGDIVSYSYTLWSMANMHKVMGNLELVETVIERAEANFTKTGDVRGLAYCSITKAESLFLRGNKRAAKEMILKTLRDTKRLGLALEHQHCVLIYDLMGGKDPKRHGVLYKNLGVTLRHSALPLNMP